jgi:hypothetical protein
MDALDPALGPVHVQPAVTEVDLRPLEGAQFGRPEPVPVSQQASVIAEFPCVGVPSARLLFVFEELIEHSANADLHELG